VITQTLVWQTLYYLLFDKIGCIHGHTPKMLRILEKSCVFSIKCEYRDITGQFLLMIMSVLSVKFQYHDVADKIMLGRLKSEVEKITKYTVYTSAAFVFFIEWSLSNLPKTN
jgi:hypothetical protein